MTAYEMRISDLSSDVSSSDLRTSSFHRAQRPESDQFRRINSNRHLIGEPASFTRGGLFFCSKDNPLDGKPIKSSGGKNAAQAPAGYHWSQCSRRAVEHVPYPPLDPCEWRRVLPHSRSEEHTSELQSLMRTSYAVSCLKKNKTTINK